jgi:D-threo-aldose 1-dehydrogenase
VLNGPSSPAQFEQSLAWYQHPIPPALWSDLRNAGLLRADAPVPTTTEGA